jgi:hypothetical protein
MIRATCSSPGRATACTKRFAIQGGRNSLHRVPVLAQVTDFDEYTLLARIVLPVRAETEPEPALLRCRPLAT